MKVTKKISLIISAEAELKKLGSSIKHAETFKRTISRLHEMTAAKNSSNQVVNKHI